MTDRPFEHFDEFDKELRDESDRAAVILASAKLDEQLHLAITKRLLACPHPQDDLLRTDGPIGTFSARIILAHRLGLIDDDFARTLHLIRRIRNDFAHESVGAKLNSGSHRDRVEALFLPFKKYFDKHVVNVPLFKYFKGRDTRGKFEFVCYHSLLIFSELLDETVPLGKPERQFLDFDK